MYTLHTAYHIATRSVKKKGGGNVLTLRDRRILAGYQMDDAAKAIGVSVSSVSVWEVGTRRPQIKYIRRMAELYKCKPSEIWASAYREE